MAIDASIPLGYQPPQVTSPLDVAKGMMTLQDSMQTRQLKQLEISDYLESKQKHEKVQQLAQNKTLFDPQQGWTPEGIANVMAIDSELGGKIQQGQERTAIMQSQLQAAKAQQQDVALKRAKARQDMGLEIANNAASYWNSSEGKPPAERAAGYKETYQQSLQRMKDSGMWEAAGGTPEQFKHDFENPPPPEVAKAFSIKAAEASKEQKDAQSAQRAEETPFMKELKARGLKPGTPEWSKELKKHTDRMDAPIGGTPTANPLGSDPEFWYEYYDKTKTLPPMAWGQSGNPTREAFLKGFPEWKKKQGGTASDTAASQAQFKSNAASLTALTKDLNTFEPYKKMLDTNADIAIQLGKKIYQTNAKFANRTLNWLRQNATSDPDVAEYLAQMRFVQTEGARVINNPRIVGQLTDEARREMDQVVSGDAPIAVVERVLTRLKTDGTNRFNAMRSQQQGIVNELKGGATDEASGAIVKPAPSAEKPSGKTLEWTDADEKRLQELEKKHGTQ